MESDVGGLWNAQFGDQPPEWIFRLSNTHVQDVEKEIRECEARIENLRTALSHELFLLEWLQRRASVSANSTESVHPEHVCVNVDDIDGGRQPWAVKPESNFYSSPPIARKASPSEYLNQSGLSRSEESLRSRESSEYYSPLQELAFNQESVNETVEDVDDVNSASGTTSPTDSVEERILVRKRVAHRVTSSDEKAARTVRQRLLEQGRQYSCHLLDIPNSGTSQSPHIPVSRKRSMSDPSYERNQMDDSTPIHSDLPMCQKHISKHLSPIPGSVNGSHDGSCERELENTVDTVDSPVVTVISPSTPKAPTESHSFLSSETERDDGLLGEENSNKRESNGIDTLANSDYVGLEEDERDIISPLQCKARQRKPRTTKGLYTASLYCAHDDTPLLVNGSMELKESIDEGVPEEEPCADEAAPDSHDAAAPDSHDAAVSTSSESSEDTELTPKVAHRPMQDSNSGTHQDLLEEPGDLQVDTGVVRQDSPKQRLVERREQKELPPLTNRNSVILDEEECDTPKGDSDPSLCTLTQDTVEKALGEMERRRTERQESTDTIGVQETPQNSLHLELPPVIEGDLSVIKDAPEMSMMTLIDTKELNFLSLPATNSEPNLLELGSSFVSSLEESIELDDATICAVTLGNELFGSRSNSVSSLPGLLSEIQESMSSNFFSQSPTHKGVNLRTTGGGKRKDKKRMGNADLDDSHNWEQIIIADRSLSPSPAHTVSSRSSTSPTSESGSLRSFPLSPSSDSPPMSPTSTSPPLMSPTCSSRLHPVRHATVLIHGEVLVIRKLVVAGIVSAEKNYLDCLTAMKEFYRKPLLAVATTSQPIMTEREINTIFYRLDDLYDLHTAVHEKLEPQLATWSVKTCVGEFFVDLCRNLKLYKDYVEMYRRSLECLDSCKQESATFRKFLEDVHATVCVQYKDVPRVNELLRKPIERLQSYSLVLTDLCQHTPDDHADYRVLRESLNAMSAFITSTHDPQSFRQLSGGFHRELVKEGLVVELSDSIRKVRRVFLFHDVLISSKQKPSRNGVKFEPKWYVPLSELLFHPLDPEANRPVPVTSDMELSVMRNKIAELKAQISRDPASRDRTSSHPERDGSFKRGIRHLHSIKTKQSERFKKKLQEQQVSFWVASPSLPLRLYSRQGKQYIFLLHNGDERESWVSAIKKLQPKATTGVTLSSMEMQDLLNNQTINELHKVEDLIPTILDAEYLTGILRVRVVSASDLRAKTVGIYCCLELDEYGKFERKARTLPTNFESGLTTTWDQDFELEIVGAHIMKVMVCSKSLLKEECYAHGKIRLPTAELRSSKRTRTEVKLYPQGSCILIIEYFTSMSSMGRKPALLSSGVFGVPLEVVAQRERHDIPLIVQTCVDEVERRGMSEVGIYRVAGILRDVRELRLAFDTDYLKAQMIAFETDIHAVAGLLKRYFRELPDPLFTDELYMSFMHGLRLSDPEARDQCLVTLFHSLPPINFKTAVFLFNHLRRVAANSSENKMNLNNLATLFGPNLLQPASVAGGQVTVDVVTPVSVVMYFLNCPEEFLDESLFQVASESTSAHKKDGGRKKLTVVEEEDVGIIASKIRRSKRGGNNIKRESII